MPRPGPRPYECVRRAWHSDRHQPIRGSLIKEIFRVAKEIHSSSTKQNKEWQEKLPTVVLKAEEIMYSKANSEAEYMDLKTLWDRTNDAINTIIRRDESSETGEFLQPCIEAALNLGCTLRRASRSQRNCHPRCYLSPNTADFDNAAKPSSPAPIPRSPLLQNTGKTAMKCVSVPEDVKPSNHEKVLAMSNYAANKSVAAYPLYYGSVPQVKPLGSKGTFAPNPPCQEESPTKKAELGAGNSRPSCDLSLRLGPLGIPVPTQSNIVIKQPRDANNPVPQGIGRSYCEQLPILDSGFSFFPRSNVFEPLGSQRSLKPEEASVRKRKVEFVQLATMEDPRFGLQPKLPFRNPMGS